MSVEFDTFLPLAQYTLLVVPTVQINAFSSIDDGSINTLLASM